MKTLISLLISTVLAIAAPTSVQTSKYSNSIRLAIAALPVGGTVYVDAAARLTAPVQYANNIAIECMPGVVITQSVDTADVFAAVGKHDIALRNCNIVGGHSAFSGYNISNYSIEGNTISGYHFQGIALGKTASHGIIRQNKILSSVNGIDSIFAEDFGEDLKIVDNYIKSEGALNDHNGNGAHAIAVHTSSDGGRADALTISGDTITHYGGNAPVEVGAFGTGAQPTGVVIALNHIRAADQTVCGISVQRIMGGSIASNDIDMRGFGPKNDGIELAGSSHVSVTGNSVYNVGPGGRAIGIDASSANLVTGNQFRGLMFIVNSGTFPDILQTSDNIISVNEIEVPEGSQWLYGVWLQTNCDACVAQNNTITANRISGIGIPGSVGVWLAPDKGKISGTLINNALSGFDAIAGSSDNSLVVYEGSTPIK